MKRVPVAALMLLLVLGCGKIRRAVGSVDQAGEGDLPAATRRVEFRAGGLDRSTLLHVPAKLPTGRRPLVVVMHGGQAGDGATVDSGKRLVPAWRSQFGQDFLIAFPNAVFDGKRSWHMADDEQPLRDVQMLKDLVEAVDAVSPVDRERVFLTGFSGGAAFTWYTMCQDPGTYAGFAPVSDSQSPICTDACPTRVVKPTVYMHGTADPKAQWEGDSNHLTVAETWDWLRGRHGCGPRASERTVDGKDGASAIGRTYTCDAAPLETWEERNVAHCWPKLNDCGGWDGAGLVVDFWREHAGL